MRLLTLKNDTRKEAIGVFVSNYFTNTLNLYGMTARGADWRDDDAQHCALNNFLKSTSPVRRCPNFYACGLRLRLWRLLDI
jgi:hypothetical protein